MRTTAWLLGLMLAAGPLCAWVDRAPADDQAAAQPGAAPAIAIRLVPAADDNPARFEVTGLDGTALEAWQRSGPDAQRWASLLTVYVVAQGATSKDRPPVAGEYSLTGGRLVFTPQFPLVPGLAYEAVLHRGALAKDSPAKAVREVFRIPKPNVEPTTVVTAVYPSADVLPENLLKFYFHFSAPMSRGEAYRRIRLLDAKGQVVELPFLELDEELWDRSGKRFTLFIDPGRIKRGVTPREEVGPSLIAGQKYTLVVDAAWLDAQGNPLATPYRKEFRVAEPDETQPNPKNWKFTYPAAGSRQPLTIEFPESLDHAELHRVLEVIGPDGQLLPGQIEVDRHETRWRFTPEKNWQAGRHFLEAATILEDLAGNSIGRPFEVDQTVPIERTVPAETIRVPIEIR
jgi:hypothetical protein